MKINPRNWTIYTVSQRERKINPQPQYQRAPVWNLTKKQKLIDSILRGYDIPKIYLRASLDDQYEHEVVDGQQRLRAIWEFRNDDYELGDISDDLPIWGDLSGLLHSQLPSEAQDQLGLFELNVVIIDEADELEIRDLFLRLQEGVTLNPAEKRNAMPGEMRDFIAETSQSHTVFQYVDMTPNTEKRFGRDDWLAHIMCLELAGGPIDVKASNLKKMYEANQKFDSNTKSKSERLIKNLNLMAKILSDRPAEMNIKWGFVDLYLLISKLMGEFILKGQEKEIANFYITFEQRRRSVEDVDDLARSEDPLDRSLFDYIQAFTASGAIKKNISVRHNVYMEWVRNLIPNLTPKDPKRDYTRDERLIIWRRDDEKCQKCGRQLEFIEMHADHIVPHSKGGLTVLSNAQCLCADCNRRKSAQI